MKSKNKKYGKGGGNNKTIPLATSDEVNANDNNAIAEIIGALERANTNPEILEKIKTVIQVVERRETYSGPIPHPTILEEFDRIVPGAAKQIVDQAASETKHRQSLENKAMDAKIEIAKENINCYKKGQNIATITCIMLILGAFTLAMFDKTSACIAFIGVGAASLVGLFLKRDNANNDNANNGNDAKE